MGGVLGLKEWLTFSGLDDETVNGFTVNYITEQRKASRDTKDNLTEIMRSALIDLDFLRDLCDKELGWKGIASFLSTFLPTGTTLKRGDFGEALMYRLLEDFFDFEVPIKKLRYKITSGQSLPGADIIAIKKDNKEIIEVCFTECKLRTTYDPKAGIEAYLQLLKYQSQEFPDMVRFTAERLKEKKDPIYPSFMGYLHNRSNSTQIESFRIGLIYESSVWNKDTLMKLGDSIESVKLNNPSIDVVAIADLRNLIDEVFNNFGVMKTIDD